MKHITKHKFWSYLLVLSILFVVTNCSDDDNSESVQPTFNNLTLQQEFDGTTLDTNIWKFDIGTGDNGWGNRERQYYTSRTENVKVEDGMLQITARRESFQGAAYTSGRILTQVNFEQRYGRFEARIKLPWGQGIWPAFWMLGNDIDQVGWPQCGEIDIMEYRGQEPSIVHGSIHGPGYSAGNAVTKKFELTNDRFDTGFHIFAIEWEPNSIKFYVDNQLYNQITPSDANGQWVYDHPFFILLNVAVGGTFVGEPNNSTVFPQTMYVDYVRVYN